MESETLKILNNIGKVETEKFFEWTVQEGYERARGRWRNLAWLYHYPSYLDPLHAQAWLGSSGKCNLL